MNRFRGMKFGHLQQLLSDYEKIKIKSDFVNQQIIEIKDALFAIRNKMIDQVLDEQQSPD